MYATRDQHPNKPSHLVGQEFAGEGRAKGGQIKVRLVENVDGLLLVPGHEGPELKFAGTFLMRI